MIGNDKNKNLPVKLHHGVVGWMSEGHERQGDLELDFVVVVVGRSGPAGFGHTLDVDLLPMSLLHHWNFSEVEWRVSHCGSVPQSRRRYPLVKLGHARPPQQKSMFHNLCRVSRRLDVATQWFNGLVRDVKNSLGHQIFTMSNCPPQRLKANVPS